MGKPGVLGVGVWCPEQKKKNKKEKNTVGLGENALP